MPSTARTGPARVFALDVAEKISADDLRGLDWQGVSRVLFRTRNSELIQSPGFAEDFVYIDGQAAEFLVAQGVRLVGLDYLSIDKFRSPDHPAHMALLGARIPVIEGLDLSAVPAGDYLLVCAPLRIMGAEAAPARVFLIEGLI